MQDRRKGQEWCDDTCGARKQSFGCQYFGYPKYSGMASSIRGGDGLGVLGRVDPGVTAVAQSACEARGTKGVAGEPVYDVVAYALGDGIPA